MSFLSVTRGCRHRLSLIRGLSSVVKGNQGSGEVMSGKATAVGQSVEEYESSEAARIRRYNEKNDVLVNRMHEVMRSNPVEVDKPEEKISLDATKIFLKSKRGRYLMGQEELQKEFIDESILVEVMQKLHESNNDIDSVLKKFGDNRDTKEKMNMSRQDIEEMLKYVSFSVPTMISIPSNTANKQKNSNEVKISSTKNTAIRSNFRLNQ